MDAIDTPRPDVAGPAYSPGLVQRLLRPTATRAAGLRRLIGDGRVRLHFQPVIHLATGRPHHFEVLARPEDGRPPLEWIRAAESLGMADAFDLLVCRMAIAELVRRGDGWSGALAVNLSARSLQMAGFVDSLMGLLAAQAALPLRLSFEVTESAGIRDFAAVDRSIQALRRSGYRVCLDDFGADATSMRYLQAVGVDFVKFDGSYVRRAGRSARDFALLKAMVALCRDLGLAIIAGRVETQAQAALLRDLGVDYGQGHHFARPGPEPAMPEPAAAGP